jgi:hypothetical protein
MVCGASADSGRAWLGLFHQPQVHVFGAFALECDYRLEHYRRAELVRVFVAKGSYKQLGTRYDSTAICCCPPREYWKKVSFCCAALRLRKRLSWLTKWRGSRRPRPSVTWLRPAVAPCRFAMIKLRPCWGEGSSEWGDDYLRCVSLTFMATDHIVSLLLAQRDKLTSAIEALQGPTTREKTQGPGRKAGGNKERWAAAIKSAKAAAAGPAPVAVTPKATLAKSPVPVKKGGLTDAGRKALSIAMKKRWAAKKKAAAKGKTA